MCLVVIVLGKAFYFLPPLPLSKSRLAVKAKQPDAPQLEPSWFSVGPSSSQQKSVTRFPPDVLQAFSCRSFGAPIPQMLAHAHSRTLCSCKMGIDPLGDLVLTSKKHTGYIRVHQKKNGCQQIVMNANFLLLLVDLS